MKVLLVCLLIVTTLLFVSQNTSVIKPSQSSARHSLSTLNDTINFALQIQPILVNHCSPCHFAGGKLYEKLPFDKAVTIVDHEVALLRRIKDENEKVFIQKFVREQKK